MEENTVKISHILFMIFMIGIIIVVGTYAWLSYRSNDTAMVLTIGEINNVQVTLSPYQIKASLLPQVTYTSDNYTSVTAVNNSNTARNIRLYYKITYIDSELISSDFKYTIERSTDGTTYSQYQTGNFSSASNGAEITILEENIPNNTTYQYKVYLWIDGSNSGQSYMQGKSFSGELRADVEQPTYTVTFKDNLFDVNSSNNFNGLTISYDKTTSILTIDGNTSSANTTLSIVDGIFLNDNDIYDFNFEYLSGSVTGNSIAALVADVVTNSGANTTPRNNSRRNFIPTFSDGFSQTIDQNAAENGVGFKFWLWLSGSNISYTFDNYKVKVEFFKSETKQVTYGNSYDELPTPTRTGYTFVGWHGKNLINIVDKDAQTKNGITASSCDSVITLTGNNTYSTSYGTLSYYNDMPTIDIAKSYTLSVYPATTTGVYVQMNYKNTSGTEKGFISAVTSSKTLNSVPNDFDYMKYLFVGVYGTATAVNENFYVQLEEGSTSTPYEPYYITEDTTVVQNKDHTLTAVWQEN